ncbi:methyl-accepting chemotaxis protein [Phaeospirillum tilakii]|uniref:PAS domain S-box protein n=1 Tax=Phaeospirillum tilakii TaxID=741673 RepID=A0ABW5C853_9PROT
MSFLQPKSNAAEAIVAALEKSLAVIEFQPDGTVIRANDNFLKALGYRLDEIVGQNHAIFVEPSYRASDEYRRFWERLRAGEFQRGEFKRIGQGGREVWIEASYNPVLDRRGQVVKVVKYASDVTTAKNEYADLLGKVTAISRVQAVVEFNLDGTVITANDNFLKLLGYRLDEIRGRPHATFVDPAEHDGAEYRRFWERLRAGEFQQGQFKRIGQGGKVVWIEASYNPIFDLNGKLIKVVKFATDITRQIGLLTDLKRLIDVNFAEIDGAIDQSKAQAGEAGQAAGRTSANVQTIASSAEELAASVREIAASMAKSQGATDGAVDQVSSAGEATRRLSDAAAAMGGIVGLIQTIAGQINLLALNATIESARAGEAGKGFAVVANEVKNLANQAARATEQISGEIEGVQGIANEVVGALGRIGESIGQVRDHVASTAAAVEQQSAVTRDMSSTMQQASLEVDAISGNIGAIAEAVAQAGTLFAKTKEAAQVLAR